MTCLAILPGCRAKPGSTPSPQTQPADRPLEEKHLYALAVANGFCEAWRTRDYPTARMMMSRRLVRKYPDKRLRDAVTGLPNPRHVAYQISGGQVLSSDRVAFELRLFLVFTGERDSKYEASTGRIVLVRDAEGRWLVDEFPLLK